MKLHLRDYQRQALACTRQHFDLVARHQERRGAMLNIATGGGKTCTAANMIAEAVKLSDARGGGLRVLWMAHRHELVSQPAATLRRWWPELGGRIGIVQSRRDEVGQDIVIASVGTLAKERRLRDYLEHRKGPPALVVTDEAHHSTAPQWMAIREQLDHAAADAPIFHLGLTATPEALGLGDLWRIAFAKDIRSLQEEGYLLPERVDLQRLPEVTEHDFAAEDHLDDEDRLRAQVVAWTAEKMKPYLGQRRALVFTATVPQAEETAEALRAQGWRAAALSGSTPKGQRRAMLKSYVEGKLDAICNAAVLTEGTDLPPCDLVVMARTCASAVLWIQTVGRGLRLWCPGWRPEWGEMRRTDPRYAAAGGQQEAVVLDLAGASLEHSLVMAPVLLGDADDTPGRKGGGGSGEGADEGVLNEGSDALGGMHGERRRVRARWLELDGLDRRVLLATLGDHGAVYVVQARSGGWESFYAKKGARTEYQRLVERPAGIGWAKSMGDDLLRRAGALNSLHAEWRRRPASRKQIRHARKLGLRVHDGASMGFVSDLITREHARRTVLRLGLAHTTDLLEASEAS